MSVIPLPNCNRCGKKPATHNGYCDTCWPEVKAAKEMEGILGSSDVRLNNEERCPNSDAVVNSDTRNNPE
jgi:hypothetical protein